MSRCVSYLFIYFECYVSLHSPGVNLGAVRKAYFFRLFYSKLIQTDV